MIHFTKTFEFGSKAETLHRLQDSLKQSSVPPFIFFSVSDWRDAPKTILDRITTSFEGCSDVIVRSSAQNEDGEIYSNAGAFLSVPHVSPADHGRLASVIDEVIESYSESERASGANPGDQVLVQAMVRDVSMSGVLFTQDLSTGAPYYVINYDDESGDTSTITAGKGYSNRTLYIYRELSQRINSLRFASLMEAVEEIERTTKDNCLDIEFALDSENRVYILQVRRLTTQPNWSRGLSLRVGDAIVRIQEAAGPRLLNSGMGHDRATLYGKMPDWNPAEMIGNAPRRLAFSLYRYLITDSVWRRARADMGYFEPVGHPLMLSLGGQPFIDVRQSFRSFLPEDLPQSLTQRLADAWLRVLADKPHLHDKVEFEVALTCYSFDFDERLNRLVPVGAISGGERDKLRESFRQLTIDLVEGRRAPVSKLKAEIAKLEGGHDSLLETGWGKPSVELVNRLLEDTIAKGTVPFSKLARHAFIAKTLLDSLIAKGVFSPEDVDRFHRSVPTVAGQFVKDMERYAAGELSKAAVLARYGHLRPGTYDILSLRYDQRDIRIASKSMHFSGEDDAQVEFSLTGQQKSAIDKLLHDNGFSIGAQDLMNYVAEAIQCRESAKFAFSRGISDALEVIAAWGVDIGLTREELSHLDIRDILDCMVETRGRSLESHLRTLSEQGQKEHEVTSAIRLPYLISRPSDLVVVPMNLEQPNFVTLKAVSGPCKLVTGRDTEPEELDGRIVAVESADPGFDWIFTRPIAGLITKFGGANSHMAIRCAEFNIPAAIGCGEQIFERLIGGGFVELDCAVRQIELVEH